MKKYGICITTYNRYGYFQQMVDSLRASKILNHTKIFISDDFSQDENIKKLLKTIENESWQNPTVITKVFYNEKNIGSRLNYIKNISRFKNEEVDMVINLDSDAIFNKNWMIELDKLLEIFNYNVIGSVFFCDNRSRDPKNFVIEHENYIERRTMNGLGLTFPAWLIPYIETEITEVDHLDHYICRKKNEFNLKCVCTKKSYIEHIGVYGEHSDPSTIDRATNFIP